MICIQRLAPLALWIAWLAAPGAVAGADPEVKSLFPAGGQRGTSVELTAAGTFPKWPVQVWVNRPGLNVAASGDKGKLSATISTDAAPGFYWIRLYDADGAAAPRPFVVGTLAEIIEQEPNNTPQTAQRVADSVVVNGQLGTSGDADLFAVELKQGQMLVASLEAHETLGSPVDSVLEVLSPRGNILAYNHDENGLDPRVVFTAPRSSSYLVRVFGFPTPPNQTIALAGSDAYVYRLTLTTGPFVDYPWPLAVTRDRETRVDLLGWNIPQELKTLLVKTTDKQAVLADPRWSGSVSLAVEPHDTMVEVEPNDAAPQPIELPVTISGRIDKAGDVDVFGFSAPKGSPLVFQLESRELGYPLDGVLEVTDAAGARLARVDDVGNARDPLVAFSPPADGAYRIAVSDLNRQGSSRHVYRLRAARAAADFEATADAHAYVVTAGKPSDITLSIARTGGFDEEIAFTVTGLPDFISVSVARSVAKDDSAKTVKLTLSAAGAPFSGPIRIIGQAGGSGQLHRPATAALGGLKARVAELWLTVVPAN